MGLLRERLKELYSNSEYCSEYLEHEGRDHNTASGNYTSRPIPGSGRHMYGSGERELQHDFSLRARYKKMKKDHPEYSESQLAAALGYYTYDKKGNIVLNPDGTYKGNINKLRAKISIERNTEYYEQRVKVYELLNTIDPDTGKLYTKSKVAEKVFGDKKKESKIRYMLKHEEASENALRQMKVAKKLMDLVGEDNYIDVGPGAELSLGCTSTCKNIVFEMLKEQGYTIQQVYVRQMGKTDGSSTTISVLCPPGSDPGDAYRNRFKIKGIEDIEPGETTASLLGIEDPVRVDLSRVKVVYGDEGGTLKDGMIEIRGKYDENGKLVAACPDLDMGNAKYAQVRIAVDASAEGLGDRYIKGMAVYNPDLDCDILVNSNKSNLDKALKGMKTIKMADGTETIDVNNPFGATVYQSHYTDANGEKKLSALNIVGDPTGSDIHREGAWGGWSRNNPSQFLAKQSEKIVDNQLKLKELEMKAEYEKILSLNNPVVRKQMLLDFADSCDGAAVDLKAAPLPGQSTKVLLAAKTLKDTEIYCPGLPNKTMVALVRYPHTGPFEIPILRVNNDNKECKVFMEDAKDAVAVNHLNASRLSGADHDGDTVSVIPMTRLVDDDQGGKVWDTVVNIKGIGNGAIELPGMKNFETTEWEKVDSHGDKIPGFKYMTEAQKGTEMGKISNLITDMSNQGCDSPDKLERAVKYSMVVIDAVKHNLDWQAAEKYYRIDELKREYQAKPDGKYGGASSLMSRASAEVDVPERKMWNPGKKSIDAETGEKIYTETGRTKVVREKVKVPSPDGYWTDKDGNKHKSKWMKDKDGNFVYETDEKGNIKWRDTEKVNNRTQKSTRMAEARTDEEIDALMSVKATPKEKRYAQFAKTMKAMANTARKEYLAVPHQDVNPESRKKYANEVASLERKLLNAKKNAPRERLAQLMATQIYNEMYANNPAMDADEKSRKRSQALYGARKRTGATKVKVDFSPKEWEAINAGAISESKLTDLLKNARKESYTKLALPKESRISPATAKYINALLENGWTKQQIVDRGYSIETIDKVASGEVSE